MLWFLGGPVLALAGGVPGLRADVERRLSPARPGAAVVLDQDPRAAGRLVVRGLHGGLRRVDRLPHPVLRRAVARRPGRPSGLALCSRRGAGGAGVQAAHAGRGAGAAPARADTAAVADAARGATPWPSGSDAAHRFPSSTSSPTASSPWVCPCSRWASSPAPGGPKKPGAPTGSGTPRRPPRSSPGRSTRCTCTCTRAAPGEASAARGSRVFGFISIIFCYFGVNIWISGLHSYKM